jgi:hypothetical protein
MSRLRHSEWATRGVRRVIREQLSATLKLLDARTPSSDDRIHDSRKELKKVRAGLRLLRGESRIDACTSRDE